MAGAGFGLKLHDTAYGTNHAAPFVDWLRYARGAYLDLDGDEPPASLTMYYDPLRDLHLRGSVAGAFGTAFYLSPLAPDEARTLYDAAAARTRLLNTPVPSLRHPRAAAQALFLAKEWGLTDLAQRVARAIDATFQPSWDDDVGEFTWGCGLEEEHPRGQYNAFLAAAEAVSEGAWQQLATQPPPSGEGRIEGIDFPAVSCREARWHDGVLHCVLAAQHKGLIGQPTTFRVRGLSDPDAWHPSGPPGIAVRRDGRDLVIETPIVSQEIRIAR